MTTLEDIHGIKHTMESSVAKKLMVLFAGQYKIVGVAKKKISTKAATVVKSTKKEVEPKEVNEE